MLAGEFAQEFLLVHAVLEGLPAVDEDYGDFVGELTAEAVIVLDINFAPAKTAPALELRELLLHDLAKVTAPSGIHNHFAKQ
jgi:hypothetical protein